MMDDGVSGGELLWSSYGAYRPWVVLVAFLPLSREAAIACSHGREPVAAIGPAWLIRHGLAAVATIRRPPYSGLARLTHPVSMTIGRFPLTVRSGEMILLDIGSCGEYTDGYS